MNTLYLEPFSGLSGDMLLSALCGLADAYTEIESLPEKLGLTDGKVEIHEVDKNGIVCKHVKIVDLNEQATHSHEHTHSPTHSHDHHHTHRHLSDINKIIEAGDIPAKAKQIAKDIFRIIGLSESKIHQIPLASIHFHEVSGVDSILDIVGCAVLIDRLEIHKTYSDPVCTGFGMVKTQHGILPVPAPATADILRGIPTYKGDEKGEKVTPTGAAILKYLQPDFNPPVTTSLKIAYGPGQKNFKNPNVLRVSMLEEQPKEKEISQMYVIEANIDDASAEYLGSDFQDQLLLAGATDFFFTYIQMKKGRPGLKISALTSSQQLEQLSAYILEHTPTIGLRYYAVSRNELSRRIYDLETPYGPVKVKEVLTPSGNKRQKIEYESLQALSQQHQKSIQQLQLELYAILASK